MTVVRLMIMGLLVAVLCGAFLVWWHSRVEHTQDGVILAAAGKYDVDPALVKAVVWKESRFNPDARGTAQELGLMQLREEAAQEWADAERIEHFQHAHCLDPGTNTMAGTFYLKKLLKRYRNTDDPIPFALADYNAGRANVVKWLNGPAATNSAVFIEQIGFPSTRDYVKQVTARAERYRLTLGGVRPGKEKRQAVLNPSMAWRSLRSTAF